MRKSIQSGLVAGLAAVLALCGAREAGAAGFSIYEQGAKASAQAGAFSARADDPSALFYNPAGITQLEGWNVYANIDAIAVSESFRSNQKGHQGWFDMDDSILPAGGLFVTWTPKGADWVSFGLGAYTPFGLKTEWGPDFEGRYLARDSELKTVFVSPTAAFKLDSAGHWSLSGQVNYAAADVTLSRNIDFSAVGASDGMVKLTDKTDGWGGTIGLRYANDEGWNVGATWHSQIVLNFDDADARFHHTPPILDALFCGGSSCFPDGPAAGKVRLPESFTIAFGKTGEKWDWEFDWVYTMWDSFQTLDFDFENNTPQLKDSSTPELWENVDSWRVGFGYHINDQYEIRFGGYRDNTPVPTKTLRPTIPDGDRTSLQVGVGYTNPAKTFGVDFYYQALKFDQTETTNQIEGLDGTYDAFGHLVGIAGHWRF